MTAPTAPRCTFARCADGASAGARCGPALPTVRFLGYHAADCDCAFCNCGLPFFRPPRAYFHVGALCVRCHATGLVPSKYHMVTTLLDGRRGSGVVCPFCLGTGYAVPPRVEVV